MFSLKLATVSIIYALTLIYYTDCNFTINYEKDSFYLDGKPFRYVSGSVHYFRMPHQYWRDRLRKLRAGGLNAVSTYVEWSQHEPIPDRYDFSGDLDLVKFIKIAQEEGLYVILRPGPYICAERDFGGFPYWLLTEHPDMKLRTSDSRYTKYVEKWMNVLFSKIKSLLHGNGGPIILVQVENEYGFYHACDHKYNAWLRDLFTRHIEENAILFTTDPPANRCIACGKIPSVYATVDFGPGYSVEKSFSMQRKFEPKGPLVNSEFYPGWLTHWGEKMAQKKTSDVVKKLKDMLVLGANINFYMYYGGTNFGFTAGANMIFTYQSDITSYDYDAPISEAGDLTEKYHAIRDVIAEFLPPAKNITVKAAEKGNYGEHTLVAIASLMSPFVRKSLGKQHQYLFPLSFENLSQNFGYLLYETILPKNMTTLQEVLVKTYNDYANIYVDGHFIRNISRERHENKFNVSHTSGEVLQMAVENLGRINSGWILYEQKGILSNVTINHEKLLHWNMTSFEFKTMKPIEKCYPSSDKDCNNGQGFIIYMTTFVLPSNATKNDDNFLLDSFLDVSNLKKGFVFINDINLGRYWSTRGPQYTLYVPGVYLKANPEKNTMIIMDEYIKETSIKVKFTRKPIFSKNKI